MINTEKGMVSVEGSLIEIIGDFTCICRSLRNALDDDKLSFIDVEELLISLVRLSGKSVEGLNEKAEKVKTVHKEMRKDDLPEKDREFITKFFGEE